MGDCRPFEGYLPKHAIADGRIFPQFHVSAKSYPWMGKRRVLGTKGRHVEDEEVERLTVVVREVM